MVELFANSGDSDQMLHSAASDPDQMLGSVVSDLGLHHLPVTLLGVSRLQWVQDILEHILLTLKS